MDNNHSLQLSSKVHHVQLNEQDIYLVGTAHVSEESVKDVKETIELVHPDTICVELCPSRYKTIVEKENWKKVDIFQIIKQGKSLFLLAQLMMSSFYQRLGGKLGVKPGAEMLEAIHLAETTQAKLVLADRNLETTLKRIWRHLSLWQKAKMITCLIGGIFSVEEIDKETIEDLKKSDQLQEIMQEFSKSFPALKTYLIDERDSYLSQKIKDSGGKKIVAVVGAGHIPGIIKELSSEISLKSLEEIPAPSKFSKIIKWLIPLSIISMCMIGFWKGSPHQSIDSITVWVLSHSLLAGIGASLALAHPLTILASSVVAPFTSLNPMIAAGWVAGLVQAWLKRPTVQDLEDLPQAITSFTGFWKNPVTRILLTVALANLGSSLGTIISGSWILSQMI